jgi:hypothetical protein
VIEEIPEDEPRKYLKYPSEPKSTKVTVTREHITDTARAPKKENAINVGKLNLYKVETRQEQSSKIAERPFKKTERVEHPRKACVTYFHGSVETSHQTFRTTKQYKSIYCIFNILQESNSYLFHIFIIPPYSDSNISSKT